MSSSTEVVAASLSPSRASDFLTCPLLYRFRVIDRLPERPSPAATRGTVVHSVLERLFDLPAGDRTPAQAHALLPGEWERLLESDPEVGALFADDDSRDDSTRAHETTPSPALVRGRLLPSRLGKGQNRPDLPGKFRPLPDQTRARP